MLKEGQEYVNSTGRKIFIKRIREGNHSRLADLSVNGVSHKTLYEWAVVHELIFGMYKLVKSKSRENLLWD